MLQWLLLTLFALNSFALEITIDSAKDNFSRYSTLHLINDKKFICKEIKNDFDRVTEVICAFTKRPSSNPQELQNDFFQVDMFVKNETFFLSIKPYYELKLIANIFNFTEDKSSFSADVEMAKNWSLLGYKGKPPLIKQLKKPRVRINFPYYNDKNIFPYVGSLDIKGNPVYIKKVADVTDYLRVKKLYKEKNYEACLDIIDDVLFEYPHTLFKAELTYYRIKIHDKLKDYDNVVDNAKEYLREYSASENIDEVLSLISKAYMKIGMNSDAEYFFDRLFSEHQGSLYSEWGHIYQAQMHEVNGGTSKAIAIYKTLFYNTVNIDIAITAAYNLAKIKLNTTPKEAIKYVDKIVAAKPSHFYKEYKTSQEMMESFVDFQEYLTAAKIAGAILDAINPSYDEYEKFLSQKALWLAKTDEKSQALEVINRYIKEFPDGDSIQKIEVAKDGLFFETEDENATARLQEYDKLIEAYQNDTIGRRAMYEKAKLLMSLGKYDALLEIKESVLGLDMDLYKDKEELIVQAAIGSMQNALKAKRCKSVLDISHAYNITLSDEWDDGIYECAMKGGDYQLSKKIAKKNLQGENLDARKKWLFRYIKVDFATGNYSEMISASEDLVKLIEDDKDSQYKEIYRYIFDTYDRLEKDNAMLKAMAKIEKVFGLSYKDIERYISVMSIGSQKNDENIIIKYASKVMQIQESSGSSAQSPYVEFTLYQALINKKEYNKALEVIEHLESLELSKEERAREKYLLGSVLSKLWRNDEADVAYEAAIKRDPSSAWAKLAKSAKEI